MQRISSLDLSFARYLDRVLIELDLCTIRLGAKAGDHGMTAIEKILRVKIIRKSLHEGSSVLQATVANRTFLRKSFRSLPWDF